MLEIIRWFKGFVEFVILGKFPERFINVVSNNGVSIWNTSKSNDVLSARMYIRDYRRVRFFARKSGVRLKIKAKRGFPFFVRNHKNRVGVLGGVAVFVLVVFLMSNFIWTIEIVGLQTLSEVKVLSTLKENGLYIGTYKPNVSFTEIARKTMLEVDDIGWMSVNVLDSHACVEIKEKAKKPEVPDYKKPANVKAERDGLILSINTAEGEAYFSSGSAVVKDQLLVSCVVEDQLGGIKFVRADAQVIAQTQRKVRFNVNKRVVENTFSEKKNGKGIFCFCAYLPFEFTFADTENYAVRKHTESIEFFDTVLPLSVVTENYYEKISVKRDLDKDKALAVLKNKKALFECFELSECKVLSCEEKFREDGAGYVLDCVFTCEEDIAYQQDVDVKGEAERVE